MTHQYTYIPTAARGDNQAQYVRPMQPLADAPNPWTRPQAAAAPGMEWASRRPLAQAPTAYHAASVQAAAPQAIAESSAGDYCQGTFYQHTAPAPMYYPGQVQYHHSPLVTPGPAHFNFHYGPEGMVQAPANMTAPPQYAPAAKRAQLVPEAPTAQTKYYVRELSDGAYTERTLNEIMANFQPGIWTYSKEGYPYWVQTKNAEKS